MPDSGEAAEEVSHNLLGQRLGRKGHETRERILCAALSLLDRPDDGPVTLTGVAREACVGMTTLYLYFPDLGDLVLAALKRVMAGADEAFVDKLRNRWPDGDLEASCLEFLRAHYRFWLDHARILHLRNSLADSNDERFLNYRNHVSLPLLTLMVQQMDGDPTDHLSPQALLATVLLTGFERLATVLTNGNWRIPVKGMIPDGASYVDLLLKAEAGLIASAVAEQRRRAGAKPG